MMRKAALIVSVLSLGVVAGCGDDDNNGIECIENGNCSRDSTGICVQAPSGRKWCAYGDPSCTGTGLRYDSQDVGDGLAGMCVAEEAPDAGVDAPLPDANTVFDAAVIDAGPDASVTDAMATGTPVSNGQPADLVLGQSDFNTGDPDQGGIGRNTLQSPDHVFALGNRLWVLDGDNNRVLQWDTLPIVNKQMATYVVGQTTSVGQSPGTTQSRLDFSFGTGRVVSQGTRLLVADSNNHRVLIWNTIPASDGAASSIVLGQSIFTSRATGDGQGQMRYPAGIWTDGTTLIVADSGNHRVLIWNSFPTTNGELPDLVIGQTGFGVSDAPSPPTASSMNSPYDVFYDGAKLWVADTFNHRVLVWNAMPTANGQAANFVLGQSGFSQGIENAGAGTPNPNAIGFAQPHSFAFAFNSMFVADRGNNRVVVFTPVPTSTAEPALAVLGQPNLMLNDVNINTPSQAAIWNPTGVAVVGDKLFVSGAWHRVLRFTLNP